MSREIDVVDYQEEDSLRGNGYRYWEIIVDNTDRVRGTDFDLWEFPRQPLSHNNQQLVTKASRTFNLSVNVTFLKGVRLHMPVCNDDDQLVIVHDSNPQCYCLC